MKSLPNLISGARLIAMPFLLALALQHRSRAFAWLLLACLVSDIADGLIARTFHLESALGAMLDTAADFLMNVLAAVGMLTLQWMFVSAHAVQLIVLVALYAGEVLIALARYRRLSSFHTYTARISVYVQGLFVVCLFFWGYSPWLFYMAWTTACLAYAEEWVLLAILPSWTHDVRGLYWVLKVRRP